MPGRPGNLARVALAVVITAGAFACPAEAGRWSFGAGGGLVGGYDPAGTGSTGIAGSWLAFVSLEREIHPTLWFHGEIGHFDYPELSAGGSDDQLVRVDQAARFAPLSLGISWQTVPGASGVSGYLHVLPTLFIVRVDEQSPLEQSSFTRGVLGLTATAGFRVRASDALSMSYGVQLRRSREIRIGSFRERRLAPLSNLGIAVGLGWQPTP